MKRKNVMFLWAELGSISQNFWNKYNVKYNLIWIYIEINVRKFVIIKRCLEFTAFPQKKKKFILMPK